jgi:hypothetical protein
VLQGSGEVAATLRAGAYHMHVRAQVPAGYPAEALRIEVRDSNLPGALVRLEAAKVADMAARLAEFHAPVSDALAAAARSGAGEAASSKAETLAREGKQTVVSFNKGQARSCGLHPSCTATEPRLNCHGMLPAAFGRGCQRAHRSHPAAESGRCTGAQASL